MYFFPPKSLYKFAAFLFISVLALTGNISAQLNRNSVKKLTRGQEAIAQLSDRLPAVAAKYGKSAKKLRRLLLEDSTLHVDQTDQLLYMDDAPEVQEGYADDGTYVPEAGPFPNAQTFALHSRPGSSHVIYLDFDGHTTTNTAWNTSYGGTGLPIVSLPFSLDADPLTFNQQEMDTIQYVWQRVAEDYAAFDIDVTTEDPGDDAIFRSSSADLTYGARVVISPTNFTNQSVGGVGYVGVFNHTSTRYKPAFVMSANLSGARNLAEATSHEVGHNLGLDHDGTASGGYYQGHGDWAPIMGVGYYRSVTQWSKGEYTGANNQQDDLAVIQSYGAPLIADDYGNNAGSATVLSGTSISVSGLITTREDVDVFRFATGTGNISINLSPAVLGANLDIEAKILDASGNVVATSNPSGLAASFNQYLGAGTYYLTVDGAAAGDAVTGYSDYASIGQYSISGTLTSGGATQQPPNAVASANVTSGTTPLTVAFYGSNSSDGDGYIAGYQWNFGDGSAVSTEPNPVHVYYSAGAFTTTLTVTDNAGLSSSRTIQISATQTANQAPVAIAATSATSGYAPLAINFTGANSYDPDGSISSYQWSFGNGATSNQANASYAYTTPGTYNATLTITDNRGASSSNSVVINVLQPQTVSNFIYVGNLSLTLVQSGRAGQAIVTVFDSSGARRPGATVSGNWSGLVKGSATGVTNSNGQVVFTSIPSKKRGTFTFTVNNLSAPGYTYNSAMNSATKVSVSK